MAQSKAASLLADMRKRATRPTSTQCAFGKALEEMTPATRKIVKQANDEGIGADSIVNTLVAAGLPHASRGTARKHLRGKCQCPQS